MTTSYLDTSAALKLVVDEPESESLITYDLELADAAARLGLRAVAPGSLQS